MNNKINFFFEIYFTMYGKDIYFEKNKIYIAELNGINNILNNKNFYLHFNFMKIHKIMLKKDY